MDIESQDRVLWLSAATSTGKFWEFLDENFKEFSPDFFDSYTETIQKEVRIGFHILEERCMDLSFERDFDRTFLAILIITRIINSY